MKKKRQVFSHMIPIQNIRSEVGEDKRVYLLKEKTKNRLMKKLIDLFQKNQYFRIHLDDTGTFVWNNINGKNSIKELGSILRTHNNVKDIVQPEERVERFIIMLLKNKFIKISEEKEGPV